MERSVFDAAYKCAEWMYLNQVRNRLDANSGRVLCIYEEARDYAELTTSWQTGGAAMGFLAMYKRTGDAKYLDAAEYAGHYIMSLQVMDPRVDKYYGTIRECTPQSVEFCPRDAATAAWALVWLYETTRNSEYLDRAVRFAEWHLKYGMYNGWPKWAVFMDHQFTDYYAQGSFQSGTGLFYHDLFLQTGDTRYIEFGLKPIAENYLKNFISDSGKLILERRIFSNRVSDREGENIEQSIHNFNDDFGNQMLQAAADLFGDEKYREAARRFARFLAERQMESGYFGFPDNIVQSAVPMALMYFDELGSYYQDEVLLQAREKTLKRLLQMQILDTGNPKLYGAFEGTPDDHRQADPRRSTNMRTTMYSLMALLKVEHKIRNYWLGGGDNDGFTDPLDSIAEHPYPVKW